MITTRAPDGANNHDAVSRLQTPFEMPFVWENCPTERKMAFSQTTVYNFLQVLTFSPHDIHWVPD